MRTGSIRLAGRTRACAWAILPLLVGSMACEREESDALPMAATPIPGVDSITAPRQSSSSETSPPPDLAIVEAERVVGWSGPGGEAFEVASRSPTNPGHDRLIGRRNFEISLRGEPSTTDACGSCHRPGRPVIQAERIEDAHRYILPHHPDESGSRCVTCHAPNDVEGLVLASEERISLDHAYRLCAQCHYAQVDDWAAGTHGKRLDGWRGRRVVMGCADCHDPHQPAVQPRIPYPGPRIPGTELRRR